MKKKITLTIKPNPDNKVVLDQSTHKHIKIKTNSKAVKSEEIKSAKIFTPPPEKVVLDFQVIYNKLHSNFPKVINMNNPVIFAIGIHKELVKEAEIPKQSINKWLRWYVRKSNYYNNYQQGAVRFNLAGEQCGTVTEEEASYASSKIDNLLKKKEEKQEIAQ